MDDLQEAYDMAIEALEQFASFKHLMPCGAECSNKLCLVGRKADKVLEEIREVRRK